MTTLQERIQARIEAALLTRERMNSTVPLARRGMTTGGPEHPVIRLSVDDVARLAAVACDEWLAERHSDSGRLPRR